MKGREHVWILSALALSVVVAMILRQWAESGVTNAMVTACRFVGDVFKQALQMIIVPLVVSSVIAGIASLQGMEGFARLGGKTAGFYALSSTLAVLVGLAFVNVTKPGLENGQPSEVIRRAFEESEEGASEKARARIEGAVGNSQVSKVSDIWDLFKKMFPPNVVSAATDNGQLLGVLTFALLFGLAITRLPIEEMESLRGFFVAFNDVMIVLTRWIMAMAPIGIFALIVPIVFETGMELFQRMGVYFFTVLGSLAFHFLITMPLLLKLMGRVNPLAHFKAMRTALLTAFSTASSSATLPVTMRNVQDEAGVSKRTAGFTLPLGATVNMDGTALYECVAVVFVAQVMGISMGFGEQFVVVIAALLTSVGVAGIPSASLVAILLILKNSGIPNAEAAAFALLAVDRPLDMCRTAVNVFGDSCAAVIIAKSEGEELRV